MQLTHILKLLQYTEIKSFILKNSVPTFNFVQIKIRLYLKQSWFFKGCNCPFPSLKSQASKRKIHLNCCDFNLSSIHTALFYIKIITERGAWNWNSHVIISLTETGKKILSWFMISFAQKYVVFVSSDLSFRVEVHPPRTSLNTMEEKKTANYAQFPFVSNFMFARLKW